MGTRSRTSHGIASLASLASLSVFAATLATPTSAQADIPEFSSMYPFRPNNTAKSFFLATLAAQDQGVNIADCENTSDVIVFSFNLVSISGWQSIDSIRFYSSLAADSCQDESVRSDGNSTGVAASATCNRVAAFPISYLQGSLTGELAIPLGLVVAGVTQLPSPATAPYFNSDLYDGVSVTTRRTFSEPSFDVTTYCNPTQTAGDGPQTMYLHAILFQGDLPLGTAASNTDAGTSVSTVEATQQINFDVWGPEPPSGLSVGVGDTILYANWSGASASTDIFSYAAYCYPNANVDAGTSDAAADVDAGPVDTGANVDAGADVDAAAVDSNDEAGDAGDATLADSTLDAGVDADAGDETQGTVQAALCPSGLPSDMQTGATVNADLAPYQCGNGGSATSTSSLIEIDNLTDQQYYAVFIAGVDYYGNPGYLSTEMCGFPIHTIDFYTDYKSDGGTAGGGFCEISPGPSGGAIAIWMVACAGTLVTRRLRRRRAGVGR